MRLLDFIVKVCENTQERMERDAIVANIPFRKSKKHLKSMVNDFISFINIEKRKDGYLLIKEKLGDTQHLEDVLDSGYWVFAYFFSLDFYEFRYFKEEKEALTYYKSLTPEKFCGDKFFLYLEEGLV